MKKALREEIYDIPSELLERVFDKIVEYIGYDEFADYLNYEGMGINEDKDDDDYFDEVESTFCEALKDDPLQVIDTLKDMGYLAEDEVVELESILYDEDPIEVDDAEFEESIKTNKKSIREAKFEFYKKGDGKIGVKAPKNVSKSSKVSNKMSNIDSHEEWVDVDLSSNMGAYAKDAFNVAKNSGKLDKIINKDDTNSADIELDYQDRVLLTPDGSQSKEVIGTLKERRAKRMKAIRESVGKEDWVALMPFDNEVARIFKEWNFLPITTSKGDKMFLGIAAFVRDCMDECGLEQLEAFDAYAIKNNKIYVEDDNIGTKIKL